MTGGSGEPAGKAPGVGVAFGGGVIYSMAGVGVARVLEAAGIPIVAVSGTSGGALVGAAVASGLPGWELLQVATAMNWRDLVAFSPNRMGVLDGTPMARFVEQVTRCRTFDQLRTPLAVVATNILTGEGVRLTSGPLGPAIQASCAVPGLFQPVRREDRLLVDGGIVDNLPVPAVKAFRPAVTLAVDALTRSDQYQGTLRSGAHVVLKAYHTMVMKLCGGLERRADLVVAPDLTGCSVLNFRDSATLIRRGESAAEAVLPALRAKLAERLERRGPMDGR